MHDLPPVGPLLSPGAGLGGTGGWGRRGRRGEGHSDETGQEGPKLFAGEATQLAHVTGQERREDLWRGRLHRQPSGHLSHHWRETRRQGKTATAYSNITAKAVCYATQSNLQISRSTTVQVYTIRANLGKISPLDSARMNSRVQTVEDIPSSCSLTVHHTTTLPVLN